MELMYIPLAQFAPRVLDSILTEKNLLPRWEQVLSCKTAIPNQRNEVEKLSLPGHPTTCTLSFIPGIKELESFAALTGKTIFYC